MSADDHPSVNIVRRVELLRREAERLERLSGLQQADRAAIVQVKLALNRVRDRHREALGFAEAPDNRAYAAEVAHDYR